MGYVFTLFLTLVSWCSTSQATLALSTTEAEYMAMTEAIKEGIWQQGLVDDLRIKHDQLKSIVIAWVLLLKKNQIYYAWTKHIDVRFHFVREILEEADLVPEKIQTMENLQICLPRWFREQSSTIVRTYSIFFQLLELGRAWKTPRGGGWIGVNANLMIFLNK